MQEILDIKSSKNMSRSITLPWNMPGTRYLFWVLGILVCTVIGVSLATEQYMITFGLFAIFFGIAIFLIPYFGILIYTALIYTRPQDYVPGIAGRPVILVLMLLTFGCWLLRVLIFRQRGFIKAPQNFLFLGLILIATLSCIPVWLTAAKEAFMDFLKIFLAYFLIVNLIDTHKKFSLFIWVMFIGTIYIATLGIFQHYGIAPEIAGTTPEINLGRVQGFGIFDNANYLAYGIAFMLPFAIYAIYYFHSWMWKLFFLSVIFVFFFCIHFTGSRGGLLAAAITIPFCFFQDRKPKVSLIGSLISIGIVFILIKTVPILGSVETYQDDESAMGRVEAWSAGLNMLKASPLLGVGYKQFQENWIRDSHNSFVRVGGELGAIGLFVWIGLLYYSYKYLRAVTQSSVKMKLHHYVKSLKGTIFPFIIGSLFASLAYSMLLYFLHALAVVAGQLYLPEEKIKEIGQIQLNDILIIGGIEVLVICTWYIFPKL